MNDLLDPERLRASASASRPWLWVVLALVLFVAANVVALGICLTHPPVVLR